MTRKTKITLIVICSIMLACLLICGVGYVFFRNAAQSVAQSAAQTPEEAAAMGSEIADFKLPTGYSAQTGINLMGVTMVFYNRPNDTKNIIMLMQMPTEEELDEAQFDQMRSQMENQSGRRLENVKTVEDRAATIRGKPGRVVVQEGTNTDGAKFRQMMVAFQGKKGLALMMIAGPAKGWNQSSLNKLIKTIK